MPASGAMGLSGLGYPMDLSLLHMFDIDCQESSVKVWQEIEQRSTSMSAGNGIPQGSQDLEHSRFKASNELSASASHQDYAGKWQGSMPTIASLGSLLVKQPSHAHQIQLGVPTSSIELPELQAQPGKQIGPGRNHHSIRVNTLGVPFKSADPNCPTVFTGSTPTLEGKRQVCGASWVFFKETNCRLTK